MSGKIMVISAICLILIIVFLHWFFFYSYKKIDDKYIKKIVVERNFSNSIAINLFRLFPDYKKNRLFIFIYDSFKQKKPKHLIKIITPFIQDKKFNKSSLLQIINNLIEREKEQRKKPNKELKEFYIMVNNNTDLLPETINQLIMYYCYFLEDYKTLKVYYAKLDEYYKKNSYKDMDDNDKLFMALNSVAVERHKDCQKFLKMVKMKNFFYYLLATIMTKNNDKAMKAYYNQAVKMDKDQSRIIYYFVPELNTKNIDIDSIYEEIWGPTINIEIKETKFKVNKLDDKVIDAYIDKIEYIFQLVLKAVLPEKDKLGRYKVINLTYSVTPSKTVESYAVDLDKAKKPGEE